MKYAIALLVVLSSASALAITNGKDLAFDQVPSVVLIENKIDGSLGSGIVINDHLILTAWHVVPTQKPSDYKVNGQFEVTGILVDKANKFGSGGTVLDLALVSYTGSLPALPLNKAALPPTPIPVDILGFGMAFRKGSIDFDETTVKRIGRNSLSPASRNDLYLNLSYEMTGYQSGQPAGALPGDSGGPMLWNGAVIGVASKSAFGTSNYVNLLGKGAQGFLKAAKAKGWKIP